MERCKVYKGLDSPCRIKGLLTRFFYVMFIMRIMSVGAFIMFLIELMGTGDMGSFVISVAILVGILAVCQRIFYRRSNIPKVKMNKAIYTITNRELYKVINNKKKTLNG